ncbi:hypothetical protein DyAD56_13280 [Dyella sp. AD56]|nr:hypothetical protein DyAD56_13280 [Dyella sp. AD56]
MEWYRTKLPMLAASDSARTTNGQERAPHDALVLPGAENQKAGSTAWGHRPTPQPTQPASLGRRRRPGGCAARRHNQRTERATPEAREQRPITLRHTRRRLRAPAGRQTSRRTLCGVESAPVHAHFPRAGQDAPASVRPAPGRRASAPLLSTPRASGTLARQSRGWTGPNGQARTAMPTSRCAVRALRRSRQHDYGESRVDPPLLPWPNRGHRT